MYVIKKFNMYLSDYDGYVERVPFENIYTATVDEYELTTLLKKAMFFDTVKEAEAVSYRIASSYVVELSEVSL